MTTAQRVYWYAPFNNAEEWSLASEVSRQGVDLFLHSMSHRFGAELSDPPGSGYEVLRDLPPPAGETSHPSKVERASVAVRRSRLRQAAIASDAFDLCHIHTINQFTDWWAIPRLRKAARPLILSVHNVVPHARRLPGMLDARLLGRAYHSADHIIVAHEALAEALGTRFAIPTSRVSVVPLAIPKKLDAGEQADVPLTVLFFGTMRVNKGVPVLLEAIRQLEDLRDVRFVFAGRGDQSVERSVVAASDSDSRIHADFRYVDPTQQEEYFRQAAVVVLPYIEMPAQSGVLRDAYAFARPVLVTDVGAVGEAVRSEGTGIVVRSGDADALAQGLRLLLGASDLRHEFAGQAASMAADRSPERIAEELVSVYTQVGC